MEETYQLIEGSPTLRDLDAENGFLWCPFGHSGRQNEPGILISRLDDGSYDVRLGTGFDSPIRFAIRDLEWSWMDMAMEETVELTFADDMALNDWIASETTATGTAWARCFNPYCGPDEKTLNTSEIIDTLRRFESPSYIVRGPIEDIESLPVGYYWCPDALDPDPSYNGYLLNVFAAFGGRRAPGQILRALRRGHAERRALLRVRRRLGRLVPQPPRLVRGRCGHGRRRLSAGSWRTTPNPSRPSSGTAPPGSSASPRTARRPPRASTMRSRP